MFRKPGSCMTMLGYSNRDPGSLAELTDAFPVIVLARVQSIIPGRDNNPAPSPLRAMDLQLTVGEVLKGAASLKQIVVDGFTNPDDCRPAAVGQQYLLFLNQPQNPTTQPNGDPRYQIYVHGVLSANGDKAYVMLGNKVSTQIQEMDLQGILKLVRSRVAQSR